MTKVPKKYLSEIVDTAQQTVTLQYRLLGIVMAGLADRPKPGAKKKAREALREILMSNGELRYHIWSRLPMDVRGQSPEWHPVKKT